MTGHRHERLEIPARTRIDVMLAAGSLRVTGGEPGVVEVDVRGPDADAWVVRRRGHTVEVQPDGGAWRRWRPCDVTVSLPPDVQVRARLASATGDITTTVAGLGVDTASGDVHARDVTGDLRVKSASGDVRAGHVGGDVTVNSASGSVTLGPVEGHARLHTASGDVALDACASSLVVRTASGDVEVGRFAGPHLACVTMSGDVRVAVERGRTLDLDLHTLSGDIRNDFEVGAGGGSAPDGDEGRIDVRTLSGDIALVAAHPARSD